MCQTNKHYNQTKLKVMSCYQIVTRSILQSTILETKKIETKKIEYIIT